MSRRRLAGDCICGECVRRGESCCVTRRPRRRLSIVGRGSCGCFCRHLLVSVGIGRARCSGVIIDQFPLQHVVDVAAYEQLLSGRLVRIQNQRVHRRARSVDQGGAVELHRLDQVGLGGLGSLCASNFSVDARGQRALRTHGPGSLRADVALQNGICCHPRCCFALVRCLSCRCFCCIGCTPRRSLRVDVVLQRGICSLTCCGFGIIRCQSRRRLGCYLLVSVGLRCTLDSADITQVSQGLCRPGTRLKFQMTYRRNTAVEPKVANSQRGGIKRRPSEVQPCSGVRREGLFIARAVSIGLVVVNQSARQLRNRHVGCAIQSSYSIYRSHKRQRNFAGNIDVQVS